MCLAPELHMRVEGSRRRMVVAQRYARDFDVATERGFGRRDPATIPALLRIHRELYH